MKSNFKFKNVLQMTIFDGDKIISDGIKIFEDENGQLYGKQGDRTLFICPYAVYSSFCGLECKIKTEKAYPSPILKSWNMTFSPNGIASLEPLYGPVRPTNMFKCECSQKFKECKVYNSHA